MSQEDNTKVEKPFVKAFAFAFVFFLVTLVLVFSSIEKTLNSEQMGFIVGHFITVFTISAFIVGILAKKSKKKYEYTMQRLLQIYPRRF